MTTTMKERYTEDELAQLKVQRQERINEKPLHNISFEEPYNHYGNKGQVDMLFQTVSGDNTRRIANIVSFKSGYAIEKSTGPNEILRQFNKARRYFFKDHVDLERWATAKRASLLFSPTAECLKHVWENKTQYESISQRDDLLARVGFQLQPETTNGVAGVVNIDAVDAFSEEWRDYATDDEQLKAVLEQLELTTQ